ncbi:MAG: acetate--CoA ligase family protein [Spirochaetes bacterium]|nr:acetate--CoA ligase family protein [Spirochaetota bacterium]
MLSYRETRDLLAGYGIPTAPGILAGTVEEAVGASDRMTGSGKACAVKLISSMHSHKSDKGFVRLGLKDHEAIGTACRDMLAQLAEGEEYEGILVQPMILSARELILGALVDPQFGPLVAFGPGGILVDVLGGVDFLAAPFNGAQALAFIARNAAVPLLGPVRGSAAVDPGTLASCLVALGALIVENKERIASVDINPLVSDPESGALMALDFRAEGRPE